VLNLFRWQSDDYYLLEAVRKNSVGALTYGIKFVTNIDASDDTGKRALWVAAKLGHVEAARALIEVGADVNFGYSDGRTPIFPDIEARRGESGACAVHPRWRWLHLVYRHLRRGRCRIFWLGLGRMAGQIE